MKKPWVEEEIELLSKDEYQKAYKYLQKKGEFDDNSFQDFEKETRVLGRMIVRKN